MLFHRRFRASLILAFAVLALAAAVWRFGKAGYPWYETVSMYHVFVKSFYDSDGDGKGDLKGLTEKLDYIKSLNVNVIHTLPITPALNVPEMPRSQYGYEITDFKNVHPDYGTIDDFKTLTREAHKRGLHVVLDFITTVISVRHPFFQDILDNPDSKYKDWIITAPEIPAGDWMNFNDYSEQFESTPWKPLPHGGYYYSLWGNSPFLDYHNPAVRDYILSVIDFWLDAGADGFRIDATKHLFMNGPGIDKQYHQPENFAFWKELRRHITEKYGKDKILIAESIPIPNDIAYVAPNREMFDLMFAPTFINDVYPYHETDLNKLLSAPYLHSFFTDPSVYKMTPLNSRLLYHSDHDGARLATRLRAPTPDKLKAAASILTLTPSAIKIYAGDEIGIKGFSDFNDFKNKWFHSTVASMAWDNSKNGGFTTSYTPVVPITDDYARFNVRAQEKDDASLLNHYRALFKLKKDYPALFFHGRRDAVDTGNGKIYAYLLTNERQAALVIVNVGARSESFAADLKRFNPKRQRLVFGREPANTRWENDVLKIKKMPPWSTLVYKFSGFDASKLPETVESTNGRKVVAPSFDGREIRAENGTVYIAKTDENSGVLRLFKGQGEIGVRLFSRFGENGLSETFRQTVDTTRGDVVLPLLPRKTDAAIFDAGARFAFENKSPLSSLPDDMRLLARSDANVSLRDFYAGEDANFRYFKIDKSGYALQSNGGLDFAILISNAADSARPHYLSFWHLPPVAANRRINALILYERHIRTGKIQTDINEMRGFGVAATGKHLIFETPDAFAVIVAKDVFAPEHLSVAPIVWSAGGKWGDKPPTGKPVPIVERLPFDKNASYPANAITEFLQVTP